MDEIYKDVSYYFRPLKAENILSLNAKFCIEDVFSPNLSCINEIEPKLYSAYYYFLTEIDKKTTTEAAIQSLLPEVAGMITYYIASTQMFPPANKRTAAASAEMFLFYNDFNLNYKKQADSGMNEFAQLLWDIGSKTFDRKATIEWFHKHCEKK